jgi:branched-chain amino acid transport system permease protein
MKKNRNSTLIFVAASIVVYGVIQILFTTGILNAFWSGIIRLAAVMTMVSLGLNLIYGFNGQFSLGQFAFYAIGAYTAADITYRWTQVHSALGLTVVLAVGLLMGLAILLIRKIVVRMRGLDTLSAFAMYLAGMVLAAFIAAKLGNLIAQPVTSVLTILPAKVSETIVYVFAILLGGLLAAEASFLFGLPIFTLGSDYFGIATLGFTIIIKVLLDNTDTMLGFPEMKARAA